MGPEELAGFLGAIQDVQEALVLMQVVAVAVGAMVVPVGAEAVAVAVAVVREMQEVETLVLPEVQRLQQIIIVLVLLEARLIRYR